jgi:hypothetical protein
MNVQSFQGRLHELSPVAVRKEGTRRREAGVVKNRCPRMGMLHVSKYLKKE